MHTNKLELVSSQAAVLAADKFSGEKIQKHGGWLYPIEGNSAYEPSVSAGCRRKKHFAGCMVFLPAAGNRWEGEFYNVGNWGNYWSSTPNDENNAYELNFNSDNANWNNNNRNNGQSVRPVR